MSRTKHTKIALTNYGKSFALLSERHQWSVERAIVFIHGFNGSARGTWTDFLSLVDDPSACSGWWEAADLYFFHYQWESVFHQLTNNTLRAFRFVDQIFPTPTVIERAFAYRNETFAYTELFLVGHSEGGLIARKIIIEAAQRDRRLESFIWDSRYSAQPAPAEVGMLRARLRLFAPALGGDMQSGLVGVLTSLPIISNALSSSAAKKGMAPDSASVTEARSQTTRYADHLLFDCFRAHIVWAERDLIISSEKYRDDQQCWNFPAGSTHTSICKPTVTYSLPFDFVEEGVNQHDCR